MALTDFFQLGPVPPDRLTGHYNLYLVTLSYFIACLASYVALDVTERLRTSSITKIWWVLLGGLALGCGIWTMHFIGMLAFIMRMPMTYDPVLTGLSMLVAIVACIVAFFLIRNEQVRAIVLIPVGVLIGLAICAMHYTGMAAMQNMQIRYSPGLFALSVGIAILASEAALGLMILGTKKFRYQQPLRIASALVMGLAICGMHYTGMAAAVFTPLVAPFSEPPMPASDLTPNALAFLIIGITIFIMGIALAVSKYLLQIVQNKNKLLLDAEATLQQKSRELHQANQNLSSMYREASDREKRMQAILDAAADGVLVTDEQGVVEICNLTAANILSDSEDNLKGKNLSDLIGVAQGTGISPVDFMTMKEGGEMPIEYAVRTTDVRANPIELKMARFITGTSASYVVVFRDIRERKHAEEKLAALNKELVTTARLAGMAEVATSVLHNVGNVLNSVNVSAKLLLEREYLSKIIGLKKVSDLLLENSENMLQFFTQNPIGKRLPEYLQQFADFWQKEFDFTHSELEGLNHKIQHIKNIVAMQQALSGKSNVVENVQIEKLIEDAIAINSEMLEKANIQVEREYDTIPLIKADRVKIVQILVNLLKNAVESLMEVNRSDKKILVRIKVDNPLFARIEVIDNGKGIQHQNIHKIFNYGFTTKHYGHGFGLHSSSLTAQDMGGALYAHSEGPEKGATFILTLPIAAAVANHELEVIHGRR